MLEVRLVRFAGNAIVGKGKTPISFTVIEALVPNKIDSYAGDGSEIIEM